MLLLEFRGISRYFLELFVSLPVIGKKTAWIVTMIINPGAFFGEFFLGQGNQVFDNAVIRPAKARFFSRARDVFAMRRVVSINQLTN